MMKKNSGQTVIEYILLIAVLMSIMFLVFNSDTFKSYFGEDGEFSRAFAKKISCDYRYAIADFKTRKCGIDNLDYTSKNHPTYFFGGDTRFFGPKAPYPGN